MRLCQAENRKQQATVVTQTHSASTWRRRQEDQQFKIIPGSITKLEARVRYYETLSQRKKEEEAEEEKKEEGEQGQLERWLGG